MTPLVRFAGAIAAWLLAPNLIGFLGAWMAAEIATAAAYWWLAARHSGPILRDMKLPVVTRVPGEHPRLYRFAAVTNLGSTMTAVAQQLPLLTLGFFAGPVAAGLFRLAYQLSQALSQLSQMLRPFVVCRVQQAACAHRHRRAPKADAPDAATYLAGGVLS